MRERGTAVFDEVPMVDLTPLYASDATSAASTAAEIERAAREVGFFYVRGHNVSRDLLRAVQMAARYFFTLPDERKRAIAINDAHRGYVGFSQTTLSGARTPDLKESFNFAWPFAADDPDRLSGKPLVGDNQWPAGERVWREVVEDYYREVFRVGSTVLEGIAISLGVERDYFARFYTRPLVRTRLLHYPPRQTADRPDQYGAAPHTDYGCITILWQDDVGGLEVRNRNGQWVNAPCIEDTFVVNIGDMLALWSNDTFVSTPHRVVNASGRERYSIATFFDPDYDTVVECLPNCAGPDTPTRHAPLVAGEYITAKYDASYSYRQGSREPAQGEGRAR